MKTKQLASSKLQSLALLMAVIIIICIAGTPKAGAATQAEIDRLREEKSEIDKRAREIQAQINSMEYEMLGALAKKSVLDDRIALTDMEIVNINETIANYTILISEKEAEVVEAVEREDSQLQLYRKRVRDMEENGIITYLEIIFDSTSFSDPLARMDFIGDIMHADEQIYNNFILACNETIAAKEELERIQLEMEDEKIQLEFKHEELDAQLEEANALIARMEDTIEEETEKYNEMLADEARVQEEINAKVEELRRQEAERIRNSVKGTGRFTWPVPSSGWDMITSLFGNRMHPIYKEYRYHSGIDIAAYYGANIVAADTGIVITSSYDSSYGNYIVISHGNGLTTLYGHMSTRYVSEGATVTKGQVIGLIGSTGASTGPHLHFEVSINGQRTDPLAYL